MLKVVRILPAGSGFHAADQVTLDQDGRHRRRAVLTSDRLGIDALLDQPAAVQLRHGDGLKLDDGRILQVTAAAEDLLEITAHGPDHLLRLAWHLGNRHLAAQIDGPRLLIRYDHVISHMLEHLGAQVRRVSERFDPEGGAYGGAHQVHEH